MAASARNARVLSAFKYRRRREFDGTQARCKDTKWYRSKVRDERIPQVKPMIDDTEELISQSNSLFREVNSMGARSVHIGKKKRTRCFRRRKSIFKMGCMLMMIASANLVKGMKNVKARDVPEPSSYRNALDSEYCEFWEESIQLDFPAGSANTRVSERICF